MNRILQWSVLVGAIALVVGTLPAIAADKQPNIVIIWGDDIGQSNISAYTKGMMGYQTPNIDRVAKPFVKTRLPYIYNLRTDPYEKATITSNTYWDWMIDHAFLLVPAQHYVGQFLMTFKEYPPRQKAASFTVDQALEMLQRGAASH